MMPSTPDVMISGIPPASLPMQPQPAAMASRTFTRVPLPERIQVLGQIIRHQADAVAPLGLYYNPRPGASANRLLNVGDEWPAVYIVWNAHEWDVSS